jgi:hypothetical protein
MSHFNVAFISGENNTNEIRRLFQNRNELYCAVAFWGEEAINILNQSSCKSIKIICNLESGATNPKVVEYVHNQKKKEIEIRTLPKLHAKVFFNDESVLVGSTNVSTNGLSYEDDEIKGWLEASVVTNDKSIQTQTKKWFDDIWGKSKVIDKKMLEDARIVWKYNRSNRMTAIRSTSNKSILEALRTTPFSIKDRPIYITINTEDFSEAAMNTMENLPEFKEGLVEAWEGWKPPENSYFIDMSIFDGIFSYNGLYETRETELVKVENSKSCLYVCRPVKNIHGLKITGNDKKILKEQSRGLLQKFDNNTGGICVPLYEAKEILFKTKKLKI